MHELWNSIDRECILASQSPRRKEILSTLGLAFRIQLPVVPVEEYLDTKNLLSSIGELARLKALPVAQACPSALVIGGDTIVVNSGCVLGKPKDRAEAFFMLKNLSGKCHEVISAVSLLCEAEQFCETAVRATKVSFREFQDSEIEAYLDTGEYSDKAGAYAIQGKGMAFVDNISGCFYTVVGLPVAALIEIFMRYQRHRKDRLHV
jgi:septum formation protein